MSRNLYDVPVGGLNDEADLFVVADVAHSAIVAPTARFQSAAETKPPRIIRPDESGRTVLATTHGRLLPELRHGPDRGSWQVLTRPTLVSRPTPRRRRTHCPADRHGASFEWCGRRPAAVDHRARPLETEPHRAGAAVRRESFGASVLAQVTTLLNPCRPRCGAGGRSSRSHR